MKTIPLLLVAAVSAAVQAAAGNPAIVSEPSQDRWMYPSNGTPGTRSQASTFSALPGSSGVDDRWGFFLIAFDTAAAIPPGLPPELYRIKSVKLTATISQDRLFSYDPSYDSWKTYATPSVPAELADADAGRPLELHGAGFRGEWTAETFVETSPYGSSIPGMRNAYPLGFDETGVERDVSNNITQQFESIPWAVGKTESLVPGDPVPIDTGFTFSIDPALPGVSSYLRQGLSSGRVWLSLTSLHPATQQGGEFVAWYTRDGVYHQLFGGLAPSLEIDVEIDLPLAISRSGNEVALSWPELAGFTYTLQASPDLTEGSWFPVHLHAAAADGAGSYSEPPNETARFYRLALEPTP